MLHINYYQQYKGLPVFGSEIIVHVGSDNQVRSANGRAVTDISIDVTPDINQSNQTTVPYDCHSERSEESHSPAPIETLRSTQGDIPGILPECLTEEQAIAAAREFYRRQFTTPQPQVMKTKLWVFNPDLISMSSPRRRGSSIKSLSPQKIQSKHEKDSTSYLVYEVTLDNLEPKVNERIWNKPES